MINIGIPTRGRPEKLRDCLHSIKESGVNIYLYCHNIAEDVPVECRDGVNIIEGDNFLTINSHNKCTSENKGSFLGLSDDTSFLSYSIQKAYDALIKNFPDTDGVVYFNVINMVSVKGAYMLLGDKFIDRFPNRMCYYPGYKFMRGASELRLVANKLGKVFDCEEAKMNHYHPSAGYQADETHIRTRQSGMIEDDHKLFEERQRQGKLWGYNQFNLD